MKRPATVRNASIIFLAILGFLFLQGPVPVFARDNVDDASRPDRLVTMAAEYPGIEVPPDEDVSFGLSFYNKGKSGEDVKAWIAEQPEGWNASIKTYKFNVLGVHIPSGDDKRLNFEAGMPKDVKPGEYKVRIDAQTPDARFKMSQTIVIKVKAKEQGEKKSSGVKLITSYPQLRGPSDGKFEFSVDVDNKLDKDAVFDLFAQGPAGWEINFKPAYEDKYISSARVKAGQSQTVAVAVKPALDAKAGEYPINVRANSTEANDEAKLMIALSGTYGIEVGTPSGLLSLDARQGKTANMSFYIKNTGSAPNNDIKFVSFKPENWKVEFVPATIASIAPNELKQVELNITPHEEALVGDYSINVKVDGERASKNMEFRVTVKASTAWGWIGIGIILVVIGGLMGLFRFLGRR
ncbi:MAG: NEW3 domain-containing protein [Desulfobacterales bacterium]|nr:NEW3 domain-containing protein [Desulfobacterales bacterium]